MPTIFEVPDAAPTAVHRAFIETALKPKATLREVYFACVGLGIAEPLKVADMLVGEELVERSAKISERIQTLLKEEDGIKQRLQGLRDSDPLKHELAFALYQQLMAVKPDKRVHLLAERLSNLSKGIPLHVTPRKED